MKKIGLLTTVFLLFLGVNISTFAQYNLQEAKLSNAVTTKFLKANTIRSERLLKGTVLENNEDDSIKDSSKNIKKTYTQEEMDVVKAKVKIKEKYWWKKSANFYDFGKAIDSLSKIYNEKIDTIGESKKSKEYLLSKYKGYQNLTVMLNKEVKTKNNVVKERFAQYKKLMGRALNDSTKTVAELNIIGLTFDTQKLELEKDYKELETVVKKFEDDYDALQENLNGIEKGEKSEENAFAAIPSFVSATGQITPSITLLGQSNFNNSRYFADVRVFTGSSEIKSRMENLFIPEASKWGFSLGVLRRFSLNSESKTNKSEDDTRNWGVHFGVSYLGKDLSKLVKKDSNKVDTLRFAPGIFHFKLGLQHIVIPDFLSLYMNYNTVWVTQNYTAIKEAFKENDGLVNFWDGGIKCYLALPKQKNLALMLDLGFVFTNTSIKSYTGSDDRVIPNIKISLRSNFGL
jgi:DNA-binding ferritin-like protein